MKNKLIAAILAGIMVLTLSGCQLAKPEETDDSHTGNLIGVFITTEPLHFESIPYLEVRPKDMPSPKTDIGAERIYASWKDSTDENGGAVVREYYFADTEGMSLFAPRVTDTPDNVPYVMTCGDDGITDVHFGLSETDDGKSISLSGTIYTVPGMERVYYMNPIYQNALGDVWAESGSGIAVSSAGSMSQKLNEKRTVTEDGETHELSAEIEVTFESMDAPVSIRVTEMDADSVKIAEKEYAPEEIPTEFTPDAQTEYLIIAHYSAEGATRAICGKSDAYFRTYSAREDGVCVGNDAAVMWP